MKTKHWSVAVAVLLGGLAGTGYSQVTRDPDLLAEFDLAYGRNGRNAEREAIGHLASTSIGAVLVFPDFGRKYLASASVYANPSYEDRNFGRVPRAELLGDAEGISVDVSWPNYRQNNAPLEVTFHAARLDAFRDKNGAGRKLRFRLTDPGNGDSQTFAIQFQVSEQSVDAQERPERYVQEPPAAPKAGDPCREEDGRCDGELICIQVTRAGRAAGSWTLFEATKQIPCGKGDTAVFSAACGLPPMSFMSRNALCTEDNTWRFAKELVSRPR